jgi:hypothetical protein
MIMIVQSVTNPTEGGIGSLVGTLPMNRIPIEICDSPPISQKKGERMGQGAFAVRPTQRSLKL